MFHGLKFELARFVASFFCAWFNTWQTLGTRVPKGANMRKLNLELPKFRLELRYKLVKRRKPLVGEPIIPTLSRVKRKYRTGSIVGRVIRYLADHKSTRKVFAANMAVLAAVTAFVPTNTVVSANFNQNDEVIVEAQNTLVTQKGIQFPVENVKINQGYSFFHPAVDLGDPVGTPVKPIKEGVVTFAGYRIGGYGNLIILDHGKGLESYYAHLSKIEVVQGQTVNTNTEIGQVGLTGHTTGPHLHLEIHTNDIPVNPLLVLPR